METRLDLKCRRPRSTSARTSVASLWPNAPDRGASATAIVRVGSRADATAESRGFTQTAVSRAAPLRAELVADLIDSDRDLPVLRLRRVA